ncbi:MAG: LysM peptidoglycan-binding domain-containing protein [Lachnospiraceae bacterium]|nr:LysM peptidoglycan-binding domain-containing protein [Lachnospiraceae bacterium]
MQHGCTADDIVKCNGGLIKKPSLIRVGWKLVIPQK